MTNLIKSKSFAVVIVIIVSIAVNLNTLWNEFVYDDIDQVLNNIWIKDFRNIPAIFFSPTWSFLTELKEFPQNYYRPLMHIVYMFNYYLFGLKPWGWHLVNIIFHTGVTVMVFLVAERLFDL